MKKWMILQRSHDFETELTKKAKRFKICKSGFNLIHGLEQSRSPEKGYDFCSKELELLDAICCDISEKNEETSFSQTTL